MMFMIKYDTYNLNKKVKLMIFCDCRLRTKSGKINEMDFQRLKPCLQKKTHVMM